MSEGVARCALALALVLGACGARTELPSSEPSEGGSAACALPTPAAVRPTEERYCDGACILTTKDAAGRALRVDCDDTGCELHVDGVLVCRCTEPDYSNTCSHGTPTCAAFRAFFDFSAYTFSPACP